MDSAGTIPRLLDCFQKPQRNLVKTDDIDGAQRRRAQGWWSRSGQRRRWWKCTEQEVQIRSSKWVLASLSSCSAFASHIVNSLRCVMVARPPAIHVLCVCMPNPGTPTQSLHRSATPPRPQPRCAFVCYTPTTHNTSCCSRATLAATTPSHWGRLVSSLHATAGGRTAQLMICTL